MVISHSPFYTHTHTHTHTHTPIVVSQCIKSWPLIFTPWCKASMIIIFSGSVCSICQNIYHIHVYMGKRIEQGRQNHSPSWRLHHPWCTCQPSQDPHCLFEGCTRKKDQPLCTCSPNGASNVCWSCSFGTPTQLGNYQPLPCGRRRSCSRQHLPCFVNKRVIECQF